MYRWRLLMIVTLLSVLLAGIATADRTPIVQRIADPSLQHLLPAPSAKVDFQYGNLNPPALAITDWIWGAETYYYAVHPFPYPGPCPIGFHIDGVHMVLQFGPEDVPASFDVFVDLAEAGCVSMPVYCPCPGPEACTSPLFTINITDPGLYDIGIPLADWCECAFMNYFYLFSFHFVTEFPESMRPDAVTDDLPVGCTSYMDDGTGWVDLVYDLGFPGELVMWADIDCCDMPVPAESNSWGSVKSLYK